MKKHFYSSLIVLTLLLGIPQAIHARGSLTVPFGGRVLSLTVPTVTCQPADGGTAPVVLSRNIAGVVRAVSGSANGNKDTLERLSDIGVGLYKAIPLYAMKYSSVTGQPLKMPQIGDWILGHQKLVPNVATCQTSIFGAPIPFPVVESDNYGVSRRSGFGR